MKFSRREILTAFLGSPFAFAACRNVSAPVAGEIVGANVDVGHIIREMRGAEVPAANWETTGCAIIGGGASGLTAAYRFAKKNFTEFTLLELENRVGGTAQSGDDGVVPHPWGAHYLPVPFQENEDLIAVIDEMGLTEGRAADGSVVVREEFLCRDPEERVFFKGRWYDGLYLHVGESETERNEYLAFQKKIDFWVNWRDASGKRAFVLPVANCSRDASVLELDKISFGEWLRREGFTSPRLFWYCDYATRDDYGLKLDQTSAWAGLFYFCSRVRKSGDESQPFITFPEGNGRFIKHLAAAAGERIRSGAVVTEIIPTDSGVEVVYLDVKSGTVRGLRARKAIFAAPVFTAKYLIRDYRGTPPQFLGEFDHNAWFVANLHLRDRPKNRFPRDFPLAWDNIIYESPSLGYVNSTHQKGLDYGPAVFTYYFPMCHEENARAKLFSLGHAEISDIILSDLGRAHTNIGELTEKIDIMRWGHAMISPRPDFLWSGVRDAAAKPFRNIHFAHSDLSGIALFEEAFYQGIRAADEVMSSG